ncbi:MAG: hypothetical protein CENE_02634 [Candidatus Celerinatantimonas neptuna]|nr:MAG: hypothetical protein CENE_02634 [Candidatus Celerinatantimonas neptuna]
MNKTKVIDQIGSVSKLAELLGITHSAVSQWDDIIPEKQALRISILTHGALAYDPSFYHSNQHKSEKQPAPLQGEKVDGRYQGFN